MVFRVTFYTGFFRFLFFFFSSVWLSGAQLLSTASGRSKPTCMSAYGQLHLLLLSQSTPSKSREVLIERDGQKRGGEGPLLSEE